MILIKRRQFFTLLETLIAMTLTIAVLTTMAYFYKQIDAINNAGEILQKESFKMRYVEDRLMAIFPRAVSAADKAKIFSFLQPLTQVDYYLEKARSVSHLHLKMESI